ncbi:MAG: sigma-70 family RNA polymerase sigma factor [Planctomycetes bacterium]|nr:sigma-70 family RNA polymerase sigma factor [Planctomycetota bacterium]
MPEEHADLNKQTRVLVDRAKEGDGDAIGLLYRLYAKRLSGAVKKKLSGKLRAKMETLDLIQSVWKDCLSDMAGFEYRGPDSFVHWLLIRIRHKILDKARYYDALQRDPDREQRISGQTSCTRNSRTLPAEDPTPSQVSVADEELNNLLRLLDRLPDGQRQAMVLRLKDKKDFEEIAQVMGKSTDAVRKLYGRELKRIKEMMLKE